MQRTLDLCRLAKDARIPVTQGRVIDVFRSLESVDWLNEEDFRLALRTNLAGNREDEIRFDRIFHDYWRDRKEENEDYKPWRPELIRGDNQYGEQRGHEEMLIDSERFDAKEVFRELNLV
ncbi:MAG: hypothetical protein VCB07_07200, partial [Gammaproteobacteria bacterium]